MTSGQERISSINEQISKQKNHKLKENINLSTLKLKNYINKETKDCEEDTRVMQTTDKGLVTDQNITLILTIK